MRRDFWIERGRCQKTNHYGFIFMRHYSHYMTESASASHGSFCVSATRYRGAENICIIAVVVTPFEFGNIEGQILAADLVEAAHDAALQERPEAVNCLSM